MWFRISTKICSNSNARTPAAQAACVGYDNNIHCKHFQHDLLSFISRICSQTEKNASHIPYSKVWMCPPVKWHFSNAPQKFFHYDKLSKTKTESLFARKILPFIFTSSLSEHAKDENRLSQIHLKNYCYTHNRNGSSHQIGVQKCTSGNSTVPRDHE